MYLWIVIVGSIVAFVLAWALGANDVANAFGTSVGAKVLTLRQAIVLASIVEFLGAILLSSHVFDTFRKAIFLPDVYEDSPLVLMLGMLGTLCACCIWLVIATAAHLPVSSTHSAVGAVVGFTLTARGLDGLNVPFLLLISVSWVFSPLFAGTLSVLLFTGVRHFILRHYLSLSRGLFFLPFCYGGTVFFITLSVIYRGAPALRLDQTWSSWIVFSVSAGAGLLTLIITFFLTPFVRRNIEQKFDDELRTVAMELAEGVRTPKNYFEKGLLAKRNSSYGTFASKIQADRMQVESLRLKRRRTISDLEKGKEIADSVLGDDFHEPAEPEQIQTAPEPVEEIEEMENEEPFRKTLDDYLNDDVFQEQLKVWVKRINKDYRKEDTKMRKIHSKSETFDPKTEELFSFLQILTAMTAGLAHGANDVANAIAPLAVIFSVYTNNGKVQQDSPMPFWILLMGNVGLVLGLAVWGYKIIETIGENLTKVTPSRGFNIEMGSAITVLFASRIGLPVSTTHCKVGSVVGVGMVDGKKAVNWRLFINVMLAWVVTLPASGCLSAACFLCLTWLNENISALLSTEQTPWD